MDLQEAFESLVERNAYRMEKGDYMNEDDLLMYCGKCFTKKECKVISPNDGTVRTVGCICQCHAERLRREGTIR